MNLNIDRESSRLVIISIAAVVAITLLALNSRVNLGGAVVHIKHVETFEPLCVDDDPGNNYHQPGMVQQSSVQYFDYCIGDTLFQRYCHTGGKIGVTTGYACLNGCTNGACL